MSEEYLKLLDRVLSKLPKKVTTGERFTLPAPSVATTGNRTYILNFAEIAEKLNRNPNHLLKFLSKEMATAGVISGPRVIFQGRFPESTVRRLIEIYASKFVICPICKRPDTKIAKEGRFLFLVCEACGAKSSIVPS
ncbi:TPA: translation initiation factor IF-2 subunit beta [Candidatus Bathyarchaeota archaeon]|nr:translation initiation factor IF-2 subunit beta [Candidatus Bathyarchaeota archaeon]